MKQNDLSKAPLFSELSDEQLEQVAERMQLREYAKGETLFTRGGPSQALYLIKSGWVQLQGEGGTRLATLGPGSLLGENDMLQGLPYTLSATAEGAVKAWALNREALQELIVAQPEIGVRLSRALGRRLALLDEHLVERRLRTLPALAGLEEHILRALAPAMELVSYPSQTLICREGESASGIYIVESGAVQVFSSCGREGEYSELGCGEAIGEMATLTGKGHMASARTLQDTTLWLLPASAFESLATLYPALSQALSRNVRERLSADDQATAVQKLQGLPLFAGLSHEALADVASVLLLRHVPAGELIYQRGDPGDALYLIESGSVRILTNERASDAYSAPLGEGDFFGETALLTGRPRSVSVRAETDVNLWVLYRNDFERLVTRYPAISLALSRLLSERLAAADRSFVDRHLRKLSLLSGLTSKQLEDVSSRLRPIKFRAGEVIVREGAAGDVMYLIESGSVEVTAGAARPVTLATLADGEFFGEMALLTGRPRMATVKALSDVDLWELKKADFDALLLRYPSLTIALSKVLGERLSSANGRLVQWAAPAAPFVAPMPVEPAPVRRERQPMVQRTPARSAVAQPAARPSPGFGLQRSLVAAFEGLRRGLDDAAVWFGERSTAAKVRLIAVVLLLAWLCGVAAPAALISALASNNVNYQSAVSLAFLQQPTPAVVVMAPAQANVAAPPVATPVVAAPPTPTITLEPPPETPEPTETPAPPMETATPVPPTPAPTNTVAPPTPTATFTPLPPVAVAQVVAAPAASPTPPQAVVLAAAPAPPQHPVAWDARLHAMPVRIVGVDVPAGQAYWRVVEVRWANEQEAQGKHHIYVDMLDENGNRLVGHRVEITWSGGQDLMTIEDKPAPEYGANFPMYAVLGTYHVRGHGLPTETLTGLGLGTPELPAWKIHTCFYVKFQRTIR